MRLWTKKARRDWQFKDSTPFSTRCMLYLYIRTELKDSEPSQLELSYDALRKGAASIKSRKATKRKEPGEAVPAVDDKLYGEWYDLALAASSSFV